MSYGTPPRTPWALLAYTVSDDKGSEASLDDEVSEELRAICLAADFGQVSVAAQVDFQNIRGTFRGALTTFDLGAGGFEDVGARANPLWQKILGGVDAARSDVRVQKIRADLDSAHGGVLQDFFRFGRNACQPARQVVFFYGHAYGPMGMFYDRAGGQRNAHPMRLNDLASSVGMEDCHAEVLVFRDCFMSALETAVQFRGAADFMIASQSVVPIAGIWPWAEFLAALAPDTSSETIADQLARLLGSFLEVPANRGPFAHVPYSLLDVNASEAVIDPLKALVAALKDARSDPARAARCAAALESARIGFPNDHANPGDPALIDVLTMTSALQALAPDPVAGPATELADVVANRVVRWQHAQQGRFQGVSLYYKPATSALADRSFIESGDMSDAKKDAAAYRALTLSALTGWDEIALNPFVPATAGV
jgi:hypothetical protein